METTGRKTIELHLDSTEGPLAEHRMSAETMSKVCAAMAAAYQRAAQSVLTGGSAGRYPEAARSVELQFEASAEGSLLLKFVATFAASVAALLDPSEYNLETRAAVRMVEEIGRAGRGEVDASPWARTCVMALPASVRQEYVARDGATVLAVADVTAAGVARDSTPAAPRFASMQEVKSSVRGVEWNPTVVILGIDGRDVRCTASAELARRARELGETPPAMLPTASIVRLPASDTTQATARLLRLWTDEEYRARRPTVVDPVESFERSRGVLELLAAHDRQA